MAAGMKIKTAQPQLPAPVHFIHKSITGFFQAFPVRMTDVNQIPVMGKDMSLMVALVGTVFPESVNRFRGQESGPPLSLIFSKKGKCAGAYPGGIEGGVFDTARYADMRADVLHPLHSGTAAAGRVPL
jgi:hypothetical protein